MHPRTRPCAGPRQGWESFAWPRCDAFHRLGLQILPGLVGMVGEEVEDPLHVPDGAARSPAPGDMPCSEKCPSSSPLRGEANFCQLCSPRVGLGRASHTGQAAAGLVAAQNSFALVTDDFDVLMEVPLERLRPQVALPTVPELGRALDTATAALQGCDVQGSGASSLEGPRSQGRLQPSQGVQEPWPGWGLSRRHSHGGCGAQLGRAGSSTWVAV